MSSDNSSETRLVIKKHYPIGRDLVFKMWTEPEHLKRWFSPSKDVAVALVEVDLKVGGRYRIGMQSPDKPMTVVGGIYTEIQSPGKLAFTWAWEDWAGGVHDGLETLVTLEFRDVEGETELILTHEHIPDKELKNRHEEGWNGCLGRLNEHCVTTKK